MLRRYGFEQCGLGGQALTSVDKQLAEGVRQGRLKAVDILCNQKHQDGNVSGFGFGVQNGRWGAEVLRHRVRQRLRQLAD